MKIINFDLNDSQQFEREGVIALGKFESIHKGHQEVLSKAYRIAKATNKNLIIMIYPDFDGHKQIYKKQILPQELRIKLLTQYEPSAILVFEPNIKNYSTTIMDFSNYLKKVFRISDIVIGENFNIKNVQETLNLKKQFNSHVVDTYKINNQIVSSSTIKLMLEAGEVEDLKQMLGFNYFYEGEVIRGKSRGKKLGFPTANVNVSKNLLAPKEGIYFSKITIDNKKYNSITSISNNPTFEDNELKYETHIFDFDADIYKRNVYVELLRFLREPIKFTDVNKLRDQIIKDKEKAIQFFKNLIK